MPRWSEHDTDEERLPEGMQRIGYDADDQVYTFRDADGSIWESAPGNRYGRLKRVGSRPPPTLPSYDDVLAYDDSDDHDGNSKPSDPFAAYAGPVGDDPEASWRQQMKPLLNWFLVVGVFLLVVIWFISGSRAKSSGSGGGEMAGKSCGEDTTSYLIKGGDTCWAIAEASSVSLDTLLKTNEGLDCDGLSIGEVICIPKA